MRAGIYCFVITLIVAFTCRSGLADIVWNSGTLDTYAAAGQSVNDPPLRNAQSGNDNYSAYASYVAQEQHPEASAFVATAVGTDELDFFGEHKCLRNPQFSFAKGIGQASANFNVTAANPHLITNRITGITGYYANFTQCSVSITDAASQTVFAQQFTVAASSIPGPTNLTLSPGNYTINWSITSGVFGGTSTGADWNWSMVPEPASLSLLAMGAIPLMRRRTR